MTFATKISIRAHQARGWLDYYSLHIAIGFVILSLVLFVAAVAAINIIYPEAG